MTMFEDGRRMGRWGAVSTGAKLVAVGLLALVMSIGAVFEDSMVDERMRHAADAMAEVSSHVGGAQVVLGPTLLVPYTAPSAATPGVSGRNGVYVVSPTSGEANVATKTVTTKRSLFAVPTYQADADLEARFDLSTAPSALPAGALLDWSRAEVVVGVSDVRGVMNDVLLTIGGKAVTMMPATTQSGWMYGPEGKRVVMTLLGTSARGIAEPAATFEVRAKMRVSGAQRIALLPYAESTHATMRGDWASPLFDGGRLPGKSNVRADGFDAEWTVPYVGRGVSAEGDLPAVTGLENAELGMSFAGVVTPYHSLTRSLKYAPLYMALVFLTYFVFEVTTSKRLHVAQYLLVGLAQLVFYLLLLSLAEHVGFDFGFLIAGAATVALLAMNVGWVFDSRVQAMRAAGVFGSMYGMIYLLLRLEDNGLLVGAVGCFAAVAAAMYFTRSIDWYGAGAVRGVQTPAFRVGEL